MSFLRNLESKLEQLIEGGFKSAFKSEVTPVELARKLAREMDAHRAASVSRIYAPNEFVVYLSPDDREQFAHYEDGLARELSLYLIEHARKRGYSLISRPVVTFETEPRLELGTFGIQARLADAPPEERGAAADSARADAGHTMVYSARDLAAPGRRFDVPVAARRAVLETGDRRFAITPPVTIVGRGSEADVRLDDPNVSRRHAEFRLDAGRWMVTDLGSTNGTLLRGAPLRGSAELRDGDHLRLGNTDVIFVLE